MIFPSSSALRHLLSASRRPLSSLSSRSISAASTHSSAGSTASNPAQSPPSSLLSRHFFSTQTLKSEDDAADAPLRSLRGWPLFKKTYGISNFQILSSLAVSSAVVNYSPYHGGLGLLCFASLYGLHNYGRKHQSNLMSLGALTLLQSLAFGTAFSMINGQVMNEAFAVSTAAVASLTGYTLWAASKGKKFNFFGTFLCSSLAPLPGLLMASYPFDPLMNGGGALALSGGTFWLFWHMRKGIREIMADYVHNKLVRASITEALNLMLLLNAINISMFLCFD